MKFRPKTSDSIPFTPVHLEIETKAEAQLLAKIFDGVKLLTGNPEGLSDEERNLADKLFKLLDEYLNPQAKDVL